MAPHRDLGFGAEDCLFEFQVDVFPQVGAALSPAAFARASAENLSQTEEVAENIAQIGGVEALRRAPAQAGVTVTVVGGCASRTSASTA